VLLTEILWSKQINFATSVLVSRAEQGSDLTHLRVSYIEQIPWLDWAILPGISVTILKSHM
jgi:hypothetical protein